MLTGCSWSTSIWSRLNLQPIVRSYLIFFFVFFLKSALPHLMDNLTWNYSVEPLIVPKEKVNNLGNTWRYLWGNRFSFGGCCTHLVCMFGAAPCRPVSLLANTSFKQCCTYSSTLMFDLDFSSRPFYIISRARF